MTKIKIFTQSKSKASIEVEIEKGKKFIIDKERMPFFIRVEVEG